MKPRLALSTLTAACALVAACDVSEPVDYTPRYDPDAVTPVPQLAFCPQLALSVCATLRPCCAPSPWPFDENKCHAVIRAACEGRKLRAHDQALIYDDVLAGRCVQGFGSMVQDCASVRGLGDPLVWAVDHACRNVWRGTAGIGEGCTDVHACAQLDGEEVECLARCEKVTHLGAGESCDPFRSRCPSGLCQCGPGLRCSTTAPLRCTALVAPIGTPCADVSTCGTDVNQVRCDCLSTLGCAFAEKPACWPMPALGEHCYTLPGGKPRCRLGARCDHDKGDLCVEGHALGVFCGEDQECASGHCVGVCIPGGIVDPITCSGVPLDPSGLLGFLSSGGPSPGP